MKILIDNEKRVMVQADEIIDNGNRNFYVPSEDTFYMNHLELECLEIEENLPTDFAPMKYLYDNGFLVNSSYIKPMSYEDTIRMESQ